MRLIGTLCSITKATADLMNEGGGGARSTGREEKLPAPIRVRVQRRVKSVRFVRASSPLARQARRK